MLTPFLLALRVLLVCLLAFPVLEARAQFAPPTIIAGGNCSSVSTLTSNYVAAGVALGAAAPSLRQQCQIDQISKVITAQGIQFDFFYLLGVNDSVLAKVNLVNPGTYNATAVSTPLFVANRGLTGNQTGYYDTGFNPATASSPKFTQNSASMGMFNLSNFSSSTYDIGNSRSELRTLSSGVITTVANVTAGDTVATTTGQEDVSWSRSSSGGYSVYVNGAAATCAACASHASTTLTSSNFFVGASNNTSGAVAQKIVFAAWAGAALSAPQAAALSLALHVYAGILGINLPWQGDAIYVSASSFGGVPAGNDTTGTGYSNAPFATASKAIGGANCSQPILFNGDPTSPTVYKLTGRPILTCNATYDALFAGGAIIAPPTGQTDSVISLAPTGAANFYFGRLTLDSYDQVGTYTQRSLYAADSTTLYSITLNGTVLKNGSSYGLLAGGGSGDNVNLTTKSVSCVGNTFISCLDFTGLTSGNLLIDGTGVTNTLTAATRNNGVYANITGKAQGPSVTFQNLNVSASATGAFVGGFYHVIRVTDVDNATVKNSTINITDSGNAGTSLACNNVTIGHATAGLHANNAVVTGNTFNFDCANSGHTVLIGSDGDPGASARFFTNNATIANNVYTGTTRATAGGTSGASEGYFIGYSSGGLMTRNTCTESYLCYGSKGNTGNPIVSSNLGVQFHLGCLVQKAGDSTSWYQNTCYDPPGYTAQYGFQLTDDGFGNFATATLFGDNIIDMEGTYTSFTNATAGSVVNQINDDDWYGPTQIWTLGGATYSSLSTWQAKEPTAVSVLPGFNAVGSDFSLAQTSPLITAGVFNAVAPLDINSYPFANPNPSLGAYQFH